MDIFTFGFQEVGEWSLDGQLKSGVRFHLKHLCDERVIYAYRVNDAVKYIGICDNTETTLKNRMERYQSRTGAGTNARIAGLIKECLEKGQKVKILAWKPETSPNFKGLQIDLVKGLENPLIHKIEPEWNIKK
ncbi:MAG TPA: hypothetical protein ENJ93_05660 [Chloroflexi bacterium]|nr:hypothetical protein [Chloroflexota bacterium]